MGSPKQTALPLRRVARGEAGRVLKELRAQDFVFTVLSTERVGRFFQRIQFAGNGFLKAHHPYPTMWVRLWFTETGATTVGHQRAFTLVDQDPETDTFWLEFALHDGAASRWAESAQPGEQIEASLYGSQPSLPDNADIDAHLLVGDTASLPAINSLLDALGPAPAVVILEWVHAEDRALQVRLRPTDRVHWVRRVADGEGTIAAVDQELEALLATAPGNAGIRTLPSRHARLFAWGACDTVTTRSLTKRLRGAGLRPECIKTLGYWLPPKEQSAASA